MYTYMYAIRMYLLSLSHTHTLSRCGCGSGDSGCKECGCCRVCAGEKDHWGGAFNLANVPEDLDRVRAIRDKIKGKKKDKKKDKGKDKKKKKEDKAALGLQLLFGGTTVYLVVNEIYENIV